MDAIWRVEIIQKSVPDEDTNLDLLEQSPLTGGLGPSTCPVQHYHLSAFLFSIYSQLAFSLSSMPEFCGLYYAWNEWGCIGDGV